jgi:hypothetical protein
MMSKNFKRQKGKGNQRGAALVISIFGILLVTIIGFAFISTSLISRDVSQNSREQTEVYYISEAGLTHATKVITIAGQSQFNNILQAGDGISNTGDELSVLASIPSTGLGFGRGSYIIYVSDDASDTDGNPNADSNGRIVIKSVGNVQNGATVTTEAIIEISASPAILVNGRLRINGDPHILGTFGIVHANNTLDFDGNPCASRYFSSSSNIVDPSSSRSGVGCAGAGVNYPNQPILPTPTWDIRTDFLANSDYVLGAIGTQAGKVYTGSGVLIHDATLTGNKWTIGSSEWSWDSGSHRWTHGGNTLPNGTFYSEGNMEISDNFGTSTLPVTATFIAEGYISVSGNPYLRPDYQSFSLMAGTDLRISGNPAAGAQNFNGIHYAGHQIAFSGNPAINGIIIAANLADTNSPFCGCNPVPLSSDYMEISGNPTITYNGGLLNNGIRIISWREVRY